MQPYYHSLSPVSLHAQQLDYVLALGWYRMHQSIFTTSHITLGDIYSVHWLRYAVAEIKTHTSHKRIRQRAQKFNFTITDFSCTNEHMQLHQRYRASIDFDGAPSITNCLFDSDVVTASIFTTKTISIYDDNHLIAAGYFDVGEIAAASILHFFDPQYKRYSLGKYLILLTLDFLYANNFHFYYPGYVVQNNPKMDYKLFLGRPEAQYFDPNVADWKYFHESILRTQTKTRGS